jgi:hypothetical protein
MPHSDNISIASAHADQMELVKFSCNVVSNTFHGLDFETVMRVANSDFDGLASLEGEINAIEKFGIDIASIFEMIQQVVEMIMELLENCNNRPVLGRLIRNQRPVSRAWFRVQIFNKKINRSGLDLSKRDQDNMFEVFLQKGSELSDTMVETIWQEVKKPDFSIF